MRIALDIDGVLADFWRAILDVCEQPYRPHEVYYDDYVSKMFPKYNDDADFWLKCPVLTTPDKINFEVACYITHRTIEPAVSKYWLRKNNFPDAPVVLAHPDGDKWMELKVYNIDLFVDDKLDTFISLNEKGFNCLLFSAPHNAHYETDKRISCLSEVKNFIK